MKYHLIFHERATYFTGTHEIHKRMKCQSIFHDHSEVSTLFIYLMYTFRIFLSSKHRGYAIDKHRTCEVVRKNIHVHICRKFKRSMCVHPRLRSNVNSSAMHFYVTDCNYYGCNYRLGVALLPITVQLLCCWYSVRPD